jgi:CRP-like cAMP-binding protein
MDEGDLFGEMGMLDKSPRSAGARALETSSVLEIPYSAVHAQLDTSNHLLWNVIRMLSRRLRAMDQALADSVFLDVTGRTAKRLLDLSGGKDEFTLPVTQEELAGMVGASRERVNKAIASFIKLKWLEQHDRTYHIIDRAKLQQRAI